MSFSKRHFRYNISDHNGSLVQPLSTVPQLLTVGRRQFESFSTSPIVPELTAPDLIGHADRGHGHSDRIPGPGGHHRQKAPRNSVAIRDSRELCPGSKL
eukprot:178423-Hanusia_phi.AAC.2